MRPAFSMVEEVTTTVEKTTTQQIKVVGPIDLDGTEDEAYFWVRVTQGEAEAIGIGEMDNQEVMDQVDHVDSSVLTVVQTAQRRSGPDGSVPRQVSEDIRKVTATWTATIPIKEGGFNKDEPVRVQAWALVTTGEEKLMFHVYWEDKAVKLT